MTTVDEDFTSLLDRLARAEQMEKAARDNAATMSTLLQSIRRRLAKAEQERDEAKELLESVPFVHLVEEDVWDWSKWRERVGTFLNQETKR